MRALSFRKSDSPKPLTEREGASGTAGAARQTAPAAGALKTYLFFKSVPKELKADFENDLLKVEPEQLSFLVKHAKTMKGKLDYTGDSSL